LPYSYNRNFPKNMTAGISAGYAYESIMGDIESALLFDVGLAISLLKKILYAGLSCNNLGFSFKGSVIPLVLKSGIKMILPLHRTISLNIMTGYSNEDLLYNSISAGIDIMFFRAFCTGVK
ncbi:hypothetical protein ACFL6D_05240, partial [Spirochaetota bacterium]